MKNKSSKDAGLANAFAAACQRIHEDITIPTTRESTYARARVTLPIHKNTKQRNHFSFAFVWVVCVPPGAATAQGWWGGGGPEMVCVCGVRVWCACVGVRVLVGLLGLALNSRVRMVVIRIATLYGPERVLRLARIVSEQFAHGRILVDQRVKLIFHLEEGK